MYMNKNWGGKKTGYGLRTTQTITPFGIGAMVDISGETLVHCGLDAWDKEFGKKIRKKIEDEPRLASRLGVEYFVRPPEYKEDEYGNGNEIFLPFLRFPRWHYCTVKNCGIMKEAGVHDKSPPECIGPLKSNKKHSPSNMRQMRFVVACVRGHLQDFPWLEWVCQSKEPGNREGRLRRIQTGSSSLYGIKIRYEEKVFDQKKKEYPEIVEPRTLQNAFNHKVGEFSAFDRFNYRCRGGNPSLGIHPKDKSHSCGELLYTTIRGSGNVWFPIVVSSIYLPFKDSDFNELIQEIFNDKISEGFIHNILSGQEENKKCTPEIAELYLKSRHFKPIREKHPEIEIDSQMLSEAVTRKLNGGQEGTKQIEHDSEISVQQEEEDFRRKEFELLTSGDSPSDDKDLFFETEKMTSYEEEIRDIFESIVLIHKLRETRAFAGYSRIEPTQLPLQDRKDMLQKEWRKKWLPAITVNGEGIFLKFKEEKINAWLKNSDIETRIKSMTKSDNYEKIFNITSKFVLLHTISHIFINELIYQCGYGSASIRERIYCSEGENPMSSILIYTSAGDSEGTMGGLVRMGKPGKLETIINRSFENASWCSNDPICIESSGQGPQNCNLAACHSCALLPETSCETGNRFLDRGLVVGTLDDPSIGFIKTL